MDNISVSVKFHCGSLMAKTFQNSKVSTVYRLPSKDLGQTSPFTVIRSQFRMLSISWRVSTNTDNRDQSLTGRLWPLVFHLCWVIKETHFHSLSLGILILHFLVISTISSQCLEGANIRIFMAGPVCFTYGL